MLLTKPMVENEVKKLAISSVIPHLNFNFTSRNSHTYPIQLLPQCRRHTWLQEPTEVFPSLFIFLVISLLFLSIYLSIPSPPSSKLTTNPLLGIGLALLTVYLARPNSIVIAGVRDPNHKTSQALFQIPTAAGSKLIIVKIVNTSETDALDAVELLKNKHGITSLDVCVPIIVSLLIPLSSRTTRSQHTNTTT